MLSSLLNRGAVSLTILSLFTSTVVGEVFEKLREVPEGWKYADTPSGSQSIRLQIALQQQDVDGFEQSVMEMSTPGHPSYGKHFETHEEMKRMLLPSDAAVNSVRSWLESAGVTDIEEDSDWINFRTTIDVANSLLDTEFKYYTNEVKDIRRLRTLQYSVPKSVAAHINMVQPTTRFGQIHPNHGTHYSRPISDESFQAAALSRANLSNCDEVVTPQCIKSLYNIGDYQASAESGSKLGFSSYLEESARYSDLELFEEDIAQYAKGQNFTVLTFNGGVNDQTSTKDSGEANLDLQYILGVGAPLPVTEFITGGRGPLVPDLDQPDYSDVQNEPYLEFLQNVLKLPRKDLPQVISTSYGEDEQSVPATYARTVCNLYAQLGSRGVSVIFSSGDSGVGSACMTNDGTNRTHFPPQFPAACPWVTSVGGTEHTAPERATFFSSGGFSDLWRRPIYQEAAVRSYLHKLGDKFEGLFNPHGRAFPDVAGQSVSYAVYDQGKLKGYQGTSCSAPMFGGVVGLLNDARMRHHKPPMGFLNPFLYTVGRVGLNDITHGGTTGCDGHGRFNGPPNGSPVVPFASWNATSGWDPATGLGTPNFQKLKQMALFF